MHRKIVSAKSKPQPVQRSLQLKSNVRRRLARKAQEPPDASDYVHHFASLHRKSPVKAAVLFCRVSERWAAWRGNLADQEENLRKRMRSYGVEGLGDAFCEVGAGWRRDDRLTLEAAIEKAKAHNVPIVAETLDRFLRNADYKGDRSLLPTREDFEHLKELGRGVVFATLLDPDAEPAVVRWFQQNRGKQSKGRKGGRPKSERPRRQSDQGRMPPRRKNQRHTVPGAMKRRRAKLRSLARFLSWRLGLSLNEIIKRRAFAQAEPPVARSTLHEWITKRR